MCEELTLFFNCEVCGNRFEILESVYDGLFEDEKDGVKLCCPECRRSSGLKLEKKS